MRVEHHSLYLANRGKTHLSLVCFLLVQLVIKWSISTNLFNPAPWFSTITFDVNLIKYLKIYPQYIYWFSCIHGMLCFQITQLNCWKVIYFSENHDALSDYFEFV